MSRRHVADDEHPVEPHADGGATVGAPQRGSARRAVPKHLGRGRHAGNEPRHRAMKITAAVLSLVLVAVIVFAGVQVLRLQGNLLGKPLNLDADSSSGPDQDLDHRPMQILVLGTDTRTGEDSRFGDPSDTTTAGNSDVMMLMQISADRHRVSVVSFPRDLMVAIPRCKDPETGKEYPAKAMGQLNGALASGGPGCTVAAINRLTGLNIDHFMMADFNAVTELSRTLGGVEVCVNQAIDDPDSGLKLPAGISSIQGDQALSFLRTRHGFGNGGDEGRIRAQQSFLASMVRKVKSEGTLTDIPRLYSIAETITKNLTVDDQLAQIPALINLATKLQNIDLSRVAFVTAPVEEWTEDPNRLQLKPAAADALFAKLRADEDVAAPATSRPSAGTPTTSPSSSTSRTTSPATASTPATAAAPTTTAPLATKSATPTPVDTTAVRAARGQVPVSVRNISGASGRDTTIAAALTKAGFTQTTVEAATGTRPATQVFYGAGYADQARALAAVLGVARVQVVPSAEIAGVRVDIGEDFTSGTRMTAADLGELNGQTADQVTCQSSYGNF